jgi:hypothetical protein
VRPDGPAPGAAALELAGGAALLRPEEQVLTAMLDGWRMQQLARKPRGRHDRAAAGGGAGVHRALRCVPAGLGRPDAR